VASDPHPHDRRPVSLIGTFAVFPLLGFSVNTLSLFGMILAIGLVVDDAIVVVEAVEHHIETGLSPKEATFKGHEGGLGARHRHRPRPRIGGLSPWPSWAASKGRLNKQFALTIAHLGPHLRLQRPHPFPGPSRLSS